MNTGEIRRRVIRTIADAKAASAARRARTAEAEADGRVALEQVVAPVVKTVASVLTAEGYRCAVSTPVGAVRLSFVSSRDDHVELRLDTRRDPPALIVGVGRLRGSRLIADERVVTEHPAIARVTADDVLVCLLRELVPFVDR